jgi:hypothetical protein
VDAQPHYTAREQNHFRRVLTRKCVRIEEVLPEGNSMVRRRRSVASQPYRLFSKRTTPLPLLQLANLVARTTILAILFCRIHTPDTVDALTQAISPPLTKFLENEICDDRSARIFHIHRGVTSKEEGIDSYRF